MAELIGVSTQAVSKWETDTGMPDISQIVPLAKVLEVSTDKLLGYTDAAYEKELKEIKSQLPNNTAIVFSDMKAILTTYVRHTIW